MALLLPLLCACAALCNAQAAAEIDPSPAGRALRGGGWQTAAAREDRGHPTGEDGENSTTVPTTMATTTTMQRRRHPDPPLPVLPIPVTLPLPGLPVIWIPVPLPFPFLPGMLAAATGEDSDGPHARHPGKESAAPTDKLATEQSRTGGRHPSSGHPAGRAPAHEAPSPRPLCEGFVLLYEDADFGGSSFGGLCSNIRAFVGSDWNDHVSTLHIADADFVTLYAHRGSGGQRLKVRSVQACPPSCRLPSRP